MAWVEVYLGPSQESIPVDNIKSQVPRVEPNSTQHDVAIEEPPLGRIFLTTLGIIN